MSIAKPPIARPKKRDGTIAPALAVFCVELGDGETTVVFGVMVVTTDELLEVVIVVPVVLSVGVVGVSAAAVTEVDAIETVDVVAEDTDGVAAAAAVELVINTEVVGIPGEVAVNGTAGVQ